MRMDRSKERTRFYLNGLYTGTVLQGIPKRRYYRTSDRLFPFVAAFLGLAAGMAEERFIGTCKLDMLPPAIVYKERWEWEGALEKVCL